MSTPMPGPPKKVPIAGTSDSTVVLAVVNDGQQGRGGGRGGPEMKQHWHRSLFTVRRVFIVMVFSLFYSSLSSAYHCRPSISNKLGAK